MTHPTNQTPADDDDVILLNRHRVAHDFYEAVRHQVLGRLTELPPGVDFTTRQICGRAFWALLTKRERRLAGEVLRDLVRHGQVPLLPVAWAHEYPLKFRLA